jgi:hypothetical protein
VRVTVGEGQKFVQQITSSRSTGGKVDARSLNITRNVNIKNLK